MESHSEEAPRKASLFQADTEMKNPTNGTPTRLHFFKPTHGELSRLKLMSLFFK